MNIKTTPVFPKYNQLFQDRAYRQIVLYGGSRSSKTYSLMQSMVIEMMKRKGLRITVWRNEKVTCRATVMEDFRSVVQNDIWLNSIFKENKAKGTYTNTKNNAVILFEGADSISKVLGLHQHISIFNEITEFSEAVYLQITQRTEETIFADYNPSKKFWFDRMKLRSDTIFLHSNFEDNPFLAQPIIDQLKSYEPWESGSYTIEQGVPMFEGKKITLKHTPPPHKKNVREETANTYMWLVYGLGIGAEKPNKIYQGWKRMHGDDYDELPYDEAFGLDFGTSNPTACVGLKYDGDRTFYIDQKIYKPMSVSDTSLGKLLRTVGVEDESYLVCDSAKMNYITALRQDNFKALKARKGSDSVNLGIEVVQQFIIYVTTRSTDIWDEEGSYEWELDRYNKPTDKPVKKDDHAMDAIRYIITWIAHYYKVRSNK